MIPRPILGGSNPAMLCLAPGCPHIGPWHAYAGLCPGHRTPTTQPTKEKP